MRWLAALAAAITVGIWQIPANAKAPAEAPKRAPEARTSDLSTVIPSNSDWAFIRLMAYSEFMGLNIPSEAYLARQRQCETGDNPRNGGRYAGAYGMYVGTWRQWGGREFAETPDQATPLQQTIVWIRVTVAGWGDQPPAGWLKNSCWVHAQPLELVAYP